MKVTLATLLFFLVFPSYGQRRLVGLFGKCGNQTGGYLCQQVKFNSNNTFAFYDLLHLRGWTESLGTWRLEGDTVILNSYQKPYSVNYMGSALTDSVTISLVDSSGPLPFASISINSVQIQPGVSGSFKYPRHLIDTLFVSCIPFYSGQVLLKRDEVKTAGSIEITMLLDYYGKYYFEGEKWLLKDNRLFHTSDKYGVFDVDKYFERAKPKDLKYRAN